MELSILHIPFMHMIAPAQNILLNMTVKAVLSTAFEIAPCKHLIWTFLWPCFHCGLKTTLTAAAVHVEQHVLCVLSTKY